MSFHLCKTVLHEIKGIFSAYLNINSMMISVKNNNIENLHTSLKKKMI